MRFENTSPRTSVLVLARLLAHKGMNKEADKPEQKSLLDWGFADLNLQSL